MKLFLKFIITLYLISTAAYFAYKYFLKEKSTETTVIEKIDKKADVDIPKKNDDIELTSDCALYKVAYFVDYDKTFRTKVSKSCFKEGTLALAMYNSKPFAILKFKSYVKTSPLADGTTDSYALFDTLKSLGKGSPEDGDYISLLFNYNLDTYKDSKEYTVTKDDKKLVERLADTIYYHRIDKKTAYTTKIEYEILKVDIDKYGRPDLFALVNWFPKDLPKGVRYTSAFSLYRDKKSGTRHDAISITKTRKSHFNLFQIIDIDGDGVKELILKKQRESNTSFLVYKLSVDFGYKKIDELEF